MTCNYSNTIQTLMMRPIKDANCLNTYSLPEYELIILWQKAKWRPVWWERRWSTIVRAHYIVTRVHSMSFPEGHFSFYWSLNNFNSQLTSLQPTFLYYFPARGLIWRASPWARARWWIQNPSIHPQTPTGKISPPNLFMGRTIYCTVFLPKFLYPSVIFLPSSQKI